MKHIQCRGSYAQGYRMWAGHHFWVCMHCRCHGGYGRDCKLNIACAQGSTEPLKVWGLPMATVDTWPTGVMHPLHALKYYRCAKRPGAAPCCLFSRLAGRGEGLSPRGTPGGCRTLHMPQLESQIFQGAQGATCQACRNTSVFSLGHVPVNLQ